ncbi:hypothetical protein [Streptomyces roseolilacinus]
MDRAPQGPAQSGAADGVRDGVGGRPRRYRRRPGPFLDGSWGETEHGGR